MPAKIRLQRRGKKGQPFYHIVVADGRAPRDGRCIELLGFYNPLTIPATIELNIDKSVQWLKNGAIPTETCRAILSYKGVLFKYHLEKGVLKGALTQEQAEAKYNAWKTEKEAKIASKFKKNILEKEKSRKLLLEAEKKVNEARAQAISQKLAANAAKAKEASEAASAEETENQVENTQEPQTEA